MPSSGERVGPYVLGKTIARGSTGKVKVARHKDTGQVVAVKIVQRDKVAGHKSTIAREIAIMRLLDHPHVLKLYDVFETRRHYFLVMEHIKGGELFDYIIQNARLSRNEVLRLFSQIVQGLEFCHIHHICHRDLKPENLLLDENCNIKIADFGMAQIIPNGATLKTFCGSPHYGAPEIVSGIQYDGRKSDIWSLGVVLYALVTGMLPFDHQDITELLRLVKRGVYTIPSFVDKDIQDLIRQMLKVDIEKRIDVSQIRFHPVFFGANKINLYFPSSPIKSPALEAMKKYPIKSKDDIDRSLLRDLEGLGWGKQSEIEARLLEENSLERMFYMLLLSRNMAKKFPIQQLQQPSTPVKSSSAPGTTTPVRAKRPSSKYLSPGHGKSSTPSPAPVSLLAPPHPMTPNRARASHGVPSHGVNPDDIVRPVVSMALPPRKEKKTSDSTSPSGLPPAHPDKANDSSSSSKKSRARQRLQKDLAISTSKGDQHTIGGQPKYDYIHTPRFHRIKAQRNNVDVDSARVPVTPTPKVSWFKHLFRRRPSVVQVTPPSQDNLLVGGLFFDNTVDEVKQVVRRVLKLTNVGVVHEQDTELTCQAFVQLFHQGLSVLDKDGTVKYSTRPDKDEKKDDAHSLQADPSSQAHRDRGELIFNIFVVRNPDDKRTCISFRHVDGDAHIFRRLHAELMRHISPDYDKAAASAAAQSS